MYTTHPSTELNALFAAKPYQGADPVCATFLFVGLDANYDAEIGRSPIFQHLLEYHRDAAAFWRRHKVHHPFLLPGYTGDGRFYHRTFAKIGFQPRHADQVTFIELLHVPTVGRNKLSAEDLSAGHLELVDRAIRQGSARHIFIPSGVAHLMKASGQFPWLGGNPGEGGDGLPILARLGGRTVYSHLHFSVYGKFTARKMAEIAAIRALVDEVDSVPDGD